MSGPVEPIYQALDARLALFTGIKIAWPDVDFDENFPYLAPSMPAFQIIPIGQPANTVYEYSGTYQVLCQYPSHLGREPILNTAGALRAHFPRGLDLVTIDGRHITILNTDVRPPFSNNEQRSLPVLVSWFCHSWV